MLDGFLPACSTALADSDAQKLNYTQRTCWILAEQEDVVQVSLEVLIVLLPGSVSFSLSSKRRSVCLSSSYVHWFPFKKQPGVVDRVESVVCSDIFPDSIFWGLGVWVHHSASSPQPESLHGEQCWYHCEEQILAASSGTSKVGFLSCYRKQLQKKTSQKPLIVQDPCYLHF